MRANLIAALGIVSIVAGTFSLAISATIATASASAPSSGALLGVIGGDPGLYRIDPSSGLPVQIASVTDGGYLQDLTADPRSVILYASAFVCLIPGPRGCGESVEEVLTINTSSGGSSSVATSVFLQAVAFDQMQHTLYGLTIPTCCPFSTTVVRVDATTGSTFVLDTIEGQPRAIALDAPTHTLYVDIPNTDTNPYTAQLAAIDLRTGAMTVRPVIRTALVDMAFDSRTHKLFGVTWDSPSRFVNVDTRTGATTPVGSFATSFGVPFDITIDPTTHTAFVLQSELHGDYTAINRIVSLDERTGAGSLGAPFPGLFDSIAFQDTSSSA
jgi:hypothetical protein